MPEVTETPETLETPESIETTEKKSDKPATVSEVQAVRKRARDAEAKLAEYEAREAEAERLKMSEIERYKVDLDKATGELNTLKITAARREAITKAISEIGDGWTVEHDAVSSIVDDLIYDEKTFTDKVKRVVDGVKKPKMGGQSPIRGNMPLTASTTSDNPDIVGRSLTAAQVMQLPEAQYKSWLAQNKR